MEKLLTRKEATEFLGLSEHTLRNLAWKKNKDLPFIKVKCNEAKYRLSDLEAFKEKLTISEKLLTRKEAAEFLGVAEGTLVYIALPYIKVNGVAMYRLSDLEAYKEKHKP